MAKNNTTDADQRDLGATIADQQIKNGTEEIDDPYSLRATIEDRQNMADIAKRIAIIKSKAEKNTLFELDLYGERVLAMNSPGTPKAYFEQKRFDLLKQTQSDTRIGGLWINEGCDFNFLESDPCNYFMLLSLKLAQGGEDEVDVWNDISTFIDQYLELIKYDNLLKEFKSKPEKPKVTTLQDACDLKDKTGQSYNDIMEILASRGLINISTGYWKDKPKTDLIQILQSLSGLNYTYKLERREIHEIMRSSFNVKCNESLIRGNLTNPKTDYKIPVFKLKK